MISQDIEKVLLSEEEIEKRCVELAHQIEEDYKESGDVPIVVGLLKGSVPFMAELIKRFTFPCEIDFMSVSSYDGTESIGDVKCRSQVHAKFSKQCIRLCFQICVHADTNICSISSHRINPSLFTITIYVICTNIFQQNSFKEIILPFTTPCARAAKIGRYRQPPGGLILS